MVKTKEKSSEHWLIKVGIFLGIGLLIFGAIMSFVPEIDILIRFLCFCVGFGLILASLGTTANVKYKEIVITGSGAVALIFFALLWSYYSNDTLSIHAFIDGGITAETQVLVEDSDVFLGALRGDNRSTKYEFIVENKKLVSDEIKVTIDGFALNVDTDKYLKPYLSQRKAIRWTYDKENQRLIGRNLKNDKKEKVSTDLEDDIDVIDFQRGVSWRGFNLSNNVCYALAAVDYNALIDDLLADNANVSRNGNNDLVKQGINAVRPLMDRYSKENAAIDDKANQSKMKILSVLKTISEYILKKSDWKAELTRLKALIKDDEIKLLVQDAASPDKTINRNAVGFLYAIADPRAAGPALQAIQVTKDFSVEYYMALIVKCVYPDLTAEKKKQARDILNGLRNRLQTKTLSVLDSFL